MEFLNEEYREPCWEVKITKKFMILLVDSNIKISKPLSKIPEYYLTMKGITELIKLLRVGNLKKISKILEGKNA